MTLVHDHHLLPNAQAFTIDELMHLVGMVGAGKSTLIQLLVYYLVVEKQLHITLVLNTVVESIQMAEAFQRMGASAAPALGLDRGTHRLKYGQANAANLMAEDVFQPGTDERSALGMGYRTVCAQWGSFGRWSPSQRTRTLFCTFRCFRQQETRVSSSLTVSCPSSGSGSSTQSGVDLLISAVGLTHVPLRD